MKKGLGFLFALLLFLQLIGQTASLQIHRVSAAAMEGAPGEKLVIAPHRAGSFSVDWPKNYFGNIYIKTSNKIIEIHEDLHLNIENVKRSELEFLSIQKGDTLILFSTVESLADVEVSVVFLDVPETPVYSIREVQSRAACDSFYAVPQSQWRLGLDAPKAGRSATQTHHCIVHHSAGGNGDTNYTQLVRSYYVFHTQVNGWDDIGYNYLIAANGQVFAGRDPEKPGIRQDNVLGAHFCAKNQYTMGICMIGDFTKVSPTSQALTALQQVLGWKIQKDTLDPFGNLMHPDNNGSLLPVIAGHRDGCATECPGDSLYATLDALRQGVAQCKVANTKAIQPQSSVIKIQRVTDQLMVEGARYLEVYDMTGRKVYGGFTTEITTEIPVPDGAVCVRALGVDGKYQQRIIL